MKQLFLALLFCLTTGLLCGQSISSGTPLMMTEDQNQEWLTTLKPLNKSEQWAIISERFFGFESADEGSNKVEFYTPILIMDGIMPHTSNLSTSTRSKVLSIITEDKIKEIVIVNEEPEGVFVHKVFTGMIIVTLNDQKTSKKLIKTLKK